MDAARAFSKAALGFLTVIDHAQHGLFGGYLLLNWAGQPLEFHCTAPIKPNRAQQILYGPTLEAFLYGEQIGATLVEHAKTEPLAVCTDRPAVLALREIITIPIALVLPAEEEQNNTTEGDVANPGRTLRLDGAHPAGPRLLTFTLGRNRLAVTERKADDRTTLSQRLAEVAETLDFNEPFARIREAIEEAQQAAR